jgi:hypothetical protein
VPHGRPIGPEADWGGDVQNGGVVMMYGGSVRFKGGSIARASAVRDPHRCQLRVLLGQRVDVRRTMRIVPCASHV